MKISIADAARVAHAVNRAYCTALGDHSQVPWEDAPAAIRESALEGVRAHLNDPTMTPEQSHEAWMAFKISDGWVYGAAKDLEAKTHPCLVPYADLPEAQRVKDFLFAAVVDALR